MCAHSCHSLFELCSCSVFIGRTVIFTPCVPLMNKNRHGKVKADKSEDESSHWKVELGEFAESVEILRTLDVLMNMV